MGVDLTDVYVELKPHEQWTSANSREELVETISKALEDKCAGRNLQLFTTNRIARVGIDFGCPL